MTSSWKIGAVSGLIAGIIQAFILEIRIPMSSSLGFYEPLPEE